MGYRRRKYRRRSRSPFSELFKLMVDFIVIAYREWREGRKGKAFAALAVILFIIISIYTTKNIIKETRADVKKNIVEKFTASVSLLHDSQYKGPNQDESIKE